MKSKAFILGLALLVVLSLAWYARSTVMLEREHDVRLPEGSQVLESDIAWWMPFSVKKDYEGFSKSMIRMSRSDFDWFIQTIDHCVQCVPYKCVPGAGFRLFPVKHGDFTDIHIIEVNQEAVVIELITIYT